MRTRGYVAVLGLCGLGLLTPGVARAQCTQGNPLVGSQGVGDETLKFKVLCKGDWGVSVGASLGAGGLSVQFNASEINTGKECHATLVSPTGGVDEFKEQQATCKFTSDQQVKFSIKKARK